MKTHSILSQIRRAILSGSEKGRQVAPPPPQIGNLACWNMGPPFWLTPACFGGVLLAKGHSGGQTPVTPPYSAALQALTFPLIMQILSSHRPIQ